MYKNISLFVLFVLTTSALFAEEAAIQPEDVCKSAFIAAAETSLRYQYAKATHVTMEDSKIHIRKYVDGESAILYKARGNIAIKNGSERIENVKAKAILAYKSDSRICRMGSISYE